MGQRSEVPAGSDRAATGHVRQDATVEASDDQLDGVDVRARVALGEGVRTEEHRRAHDLGRIRLADAAGMAAQEPELKLLGQLLGNGAGDKAAEAGVDAVGVLARSVDGSLDEVARGAHPLTG